MTSHSNTGMARLVPDHRKATVTQIIFTTKVLKSISEQTAHRALRQISYSSRRPHRVSLLSAKNRKEEAKIHTGSPKLDNRRL